MKIEISVMIKKIAKATKQYAILSDRYYISVPVLFMKQRIRKIWG